MNKKQITARIKANWALIKRAFAEPRVILPVLMAIATQHDRSKVKIEWSSKSWTHNIFRVWEMIFWRRHGLRPETSVYPIRNEHDEIVGTEIYCHTFESMCANTETVIRAQLARFKTSTGGRVRFAISALDALFGEVMRVGVPSLAFNNGFRPSTKDFNYLFSIAIDTTANGGSGYSHTVSGSNRVMILCTGTREADTTGSTASYNSVSMTYIIGSRSTTNGDDLAKIWVLIAPSTGANTMTFSYTGANGASISFTGADQVTGFGAKVGAFTGVQNGISYTITTTRLNSYTVESQWGQTTTNFACDNGQTEWGGAAVSGQRYHQGAYQAQTTIASKTLGFGSGNSQVWDYATAEVLEAAASSAQNLLTLLGVGT